MCVFKSVMKNMGIFLIVFREEHVDLNWMKKYVHKICFIQDSVCELKHNVMFTNSFEILEPKKKCVRSSLVE